MLPREAWLARRAAVVALRAVVAVAVLGLLAGCGDGGSGPDEPISTGDSVLSVTLDADGPDGPEAEKTAEVECDEDESDAECAALAALDSAALEPVSSDQACTELFGGPDVATLEGTIEGQAVDLELTRANGCEIERFEAALPLLRALFPDYEPGGAIAG